MTNLLEKAMNVLNRLDDELDPGLNQLIFDAVMMEFEDWAMLLDPHQNDNHMS